MPLKQTEICWLMQQPDGVVQQAVYTVYAQQQVSIECRILLADWIASNADAWFRITNDIAPTDAISFLMSAAEFLEQKLQNSDNDMYKDKRLINFQISFLRDVCAGKAVVPPNSTAQVLMTPTSFLLRLRHCLLEETCYFERLHQQDDIDGAVSNLVSSSNTLGVNLDNFVKVLERIYGVSSMNPVQQQALWTERQAQQEIMVMSVRNYSDAQKRAESTLLNYRARFNRQMARESFAERVTLHLDQLQAAYDTAAQIAMRDLARLQMAIIFARHIGDDEMVLQLQTMANEVFTFLCSSLVSNCLVLERQMPQIVRKGAKFAITPQLRMLCPSVLFANTPGLSPAGGPQLPGQANKSLDSPSLANPPIPISPNKPFPIAGCFASTTTTLAIDSMVEQRVTAIQQQQQQQQQLPGRMGGAAGGSRHMAKSNSNGPSAGALVSANVDVDVYFLSENQAQDFVKNLVLPKQNSGALIHSAQLTLDKSTKQCGAVFKSLSLSNFSRGDRKHSQLVTEEKFCLAFTCGIPMRALVQLLDQQQHTTVLASVLSLPIVVTVHNSQEANAAIATLWDNYFAELNRLPFEVPRKAVWADVKQLLNGKWKAACGQALSEQNLAYLADRLLHTNNNKRMSSMLGPMGSSSCTNASSIVNNSANPNGSFCYDNETVTWTMLAKDLLPCNNPELPRFTFWDWFHSCLKLMSKDCLYPFWPDHLVGFASHEQVEEMLKDSEPGTFLLRFSSTELGAVVIPYVKNHRNGAKIVERGYGPCTFKECEPCKVIADLKPLRFFYPSMRLKHEVLHEIDSNRKPSSKRKHASGHGYEKLEQKCVGASSSGEDTEEDGSGENSNDDSMNCDVISNTPPSTLSPLPQHGIGGHTNDDTSVTSSNNNIAGMLYRQAPFGSGSQTGGFVAFPSAFTSNTASSAANNNNANFFSQAGGGFNSASLTSPAGPQTAPNGGNVPYNGGLSTAFTGVHESHLYN